MGESSSAWRIGLSVLVVLALALLIGWGVMPGREADPVVSVEMAPAAAVSEAVLAEAVTPEASVASESRALDEDACLTPEQLLGRDDVQRDVTTMQSVVVAGKHMQQYEGIDELGLRDLVDQGDTSAMVVLGRRFQMKALGVDPASAVTTLTPTKASIRSSAFQDYYRVSSNKGSIAEPDRIVLAMQARELFLTAALEGRLFALSLVGQVDWQLGEDAVSLGWISQESFDALSKTRRLNMFPERIYLASVWYIAPELNSGLSSSFRQPEPKATQEIAAKLAEDFLAARESAGLPSLSFGPPTDLTPRDYYELVCERYREALYDDY